MAAGVRSETVKHSATDRVATVVLVEDIASSPPIHIDGARYILVLASGRKSGVLSVAAARRWIDAGASYVCAWGPLAAEVEEMFDYASFLPECGEPIPHTLMTTSHHDDTIGEALWFAFYNARAPDDLKCDLNIVVIVVDSESLRDCCSHWVQTNRE